MTLKTRGILVLVIGTVMGLALSLGGGFVAGRDQAEADDPGRDHAELFAEVLERVKREYVEPLDDAELVESAVRGMVADLDRHSQYLNAKEFEDIRISTTGSYSGVGLEVSTREGEILVISPIDGSPAARAGIEAGDVIVSIDGASVAEDGLDDTIARMRGRPGTPVGITVRREALEDPLDFQVTRQRIHVTSVRHEMLEPSIGYVRVSQFTDSTADELSQAIDEMIDAAQRETGNMLTGLVIDLRNNPGGILDSAVDVSDLFLDDGVIVTADGRTPEARFVRTAELGDVLDGAAIVVIVNRGSASASEIVAGALQDHHRALVVGTTTFGKGLVQTVMPLSEGRAIKLTTSRYYTPSGDTIHEIGIAPDIYVDGDRNQPALGVGGVIDRDDDAQLDEALKQIRNRRVMHSSAL